MPSPADIPSIPDFEIPGMSPAFDLASVPLPLTLLQWLGIKVRDTMFESQLTEEFEKLKPKLYEALEGLNAGYLLKLNIYVYESGALEIPGGSVITDIGVGIEPADALAESFRLPQASATPPRLASNESSYVWIARGRDGKFSVWHIPSAARASLESTATREAIRRKQLSTYVTSVPVNGFKQLAVAEYWKDTQIRLKDAIADTGRRLDIAKRTQALAELQRKANAVYLEHQQTMLELSNAQKREAAIVQVMKFVEIFKGALELGKVCSVDDKPISSTNETDPNGKMLVEIGKKTSDLTEANLRITKTWQTYVELLNKDVDELSQAYRDANLPVIETQISL